MTWGIASWGTTPWGISVAAGAASPATISDEGGQEIEILGAFLPGQRAAVTIGGAVCRLPSYSGGVSTTDNTPGTGSNPRASDDGTQVRCVAPPLPVGTYDVVVTQGAAVTTIVNGISVVRRDFFTILHSTRQKFPDPPEEYRLAGARRIGLESFSGPASAGSLIPALEGLIHTVAAGLLEFGGFLYTRLVPAPFASGDRAVIVSSAAGDNTQDVVITGFNLAGDAQSETLTLNGVVPVMGTATWSRVDRAVLNAAAVGTVTVRDEQLTPPERIVIAPGRLAKSAGALHRGDTAIVVEGNFRFPNTGRLAFAGETATYTAKTTATTHNAFTLAAPGVAEDHENNEVVADFSYTETGHGRARSALLPDYAEGEQLDAVSRRWGGFPRPRMIGDVNYREVVKATALAPTGTMKVLRDLLDATVGAGNYTIIEDLVDFTESIAGDGWITRTATPLRGYPSVVWIDIGSIIIAGSSEFGKAYMNGAEPQPSTGVTTVDVAYTPITAFGVYLATDRRRTNNFFNDTGADGSTAAANPTRFTSVTGAFVAGDVGRAFLVRGATVAGINGVWVVASQIDGNNITLVGRTRNDGVIDAPGTTFSVPDTGISGPFSPEDVGKRIELPAGSGNFYAISVFLTQRSVTVAAIPGGPLSGQSWRLSPNFPNHAATLTWEIPRGSVAAKTITFPRAVAHPVNLIVDYTHVRSAQALANETVQNNPPGEYFPFYVDDAAGWLREIADLLTVAGVIPRWGSPP